MRVVDKAREARMMAASKVWHSATQAARTALVKEPESPIAIELRNALRAARGEPVGQ